ncbi:MAG TPA: polysaccharide biosynthesis/export family protein [Stellaceae bacterium]|nr:polysaccharide biosynthesis/export family protein [Stellaceae bacterium]
MTSLRWNSRRNFFCIVFGLLGLLAACGGTGTEDPGVAVHGPVTLESGDRIRLTVWGQDQMTGEYLVEKDGNIAVPLAGRVQVANLTPPEAEKAVRDKLRNGLVVDPKVTVDVIQFRPIYVVGEVNHPGAYDFTSNITVINAVSLAGGFTYRAKEDAITVMRGTGPNQKKYNVSQTTMLQPGDVVTVPQRYF